MTNKTIIMSILNSKKKLRSPLHAKEVGLAEKYNFNIQ